LTSRTCRLAFECAVKRWFDHQFALCVANGAAYLSRFFPRAYIVFLLRTFGALELTTDRGEHIAGAATQRKPLLILALAALMPGGVPRDRLVRALWPGVDKVRARATLKQHLYALRRATGNAAIIGGAPRLSIGRVSVRVDVLDFADHVEHGRLREAAELMRGDILEDVTEGVGPLLHELLGEIRAQYAPQMTLVRQSVHAQRETPLAQPMPSTPLPVLRAERELRAAVQRFVRGLVTLPDDRVAAHHRAVWNSHDLLEALRAAEGAPVGAERIADAMTDAASLWRESQLVRQMVISPLGQPGSVETLEWLLEGGVRTTDRVGQALESHLLDSGIAVQFRARAHWESQHLLQLLSCHPPHTAKVLMLAPHGARALASAVPMLQRADATVVISDSDEDALAFARLQLAPVDDRLTALAGDPFRRHDELAGLAPFDLILAGTSLDHLTARPATWLTERLLRMLAPGGTLCLSSRVAGERYGPWLRHVANWVLAERDQDDIVLLTGTEAGHCEIAWRRNPGGHAWLVTLRRHAGDKPHAGRAAA
jgi:hypothetical protein